MPPKKDPKLGVNRKVGGKPYQKPDAINVGEVLEDITGKQWKIGKSIGVGGFGEIYLASDEISKAVNDKANYVIKIEPHTNGPLFVEINFYIRVAKKEMIDEWQRMKKIDSIGMPSYIASGSHTFKGQNYRFMVIPRFGQDLYKIIQIKPGTRFTSRTVQALALQIIDILEYIHEKSFIHGDIKASNLLLRNSTGSTPKKQTANQLVFLLDYGLATKYVNSEGIHLPYGPDARKAHNGTLEYTSRDAHIGAFSRRGDLEILGYNLLEWLCGKLPWSSTDTPENVHKQKQAFMASPALKKIYTNNDIPGLDNVERFIRYVAGLAFEEKPNYNLCKEIMRKGLPPAHKANNIYIDDTIQSSSAAAQSSKNVGGGKGRGKASKRPSIPVELSFDESSADDDDVIVAKKIRLPDEDKKVKRATRTTKKVRHFNWAKVLQTDPEKIVRSASQIWQNPEKDSPEKSPSLVDNPTPAMMQIMAKKKENLGVKFGTPIKLHKAAEAAASSSEDNLLNGSETTTMTPAMREIIMKKLKNAKKARKSVSLADFQKPLTVKNKKVTAAPIERTKNVATSSTKSTFADFKKPLSVKNKKVTTAAAPIEKKSVGTSTSPQFPLAIKNKKVVAPLPIVKNKVPVTASRVLPTISSKKPSTISSTSSSTISSVKNIVTPPPLRSSRRRKQ